MPNLRHPARRQTVNAWQRIAALGLLLALPARNALGATPAASASGGWVQRPSPTASASSAPAPRPAPSRNAAPPAHAAAEADANGAEQGAMRADHSGMGEPPPDANEASPGLQPGVISATIVDEHGAPMGGAQVRLGTLFQKIAEGESRSETFAKADAAGVASFAGLARGSDHAYRVTVAQGPAVYSSPPFNLRQDMGQHVLLHVYPSTSNIDSALIGMRGYLYIETRDDVFQCETLFRVFNVGRVTWVPQDVVVRLPKGFKAFKAQESMTDVRFEQVDGVGARLKGTFSPGQNEVSFRFQVPKTTDESAVFHVGLPPHVAEMRVIAEASSAMNLDVEGFDRPVPTANNNGQRVLVAVKQLRRRDEEIKEFTATLSGIPVPGPGRWFAVMIALGFSISGVFAARGAFDDAGSGKTAAADKKKARELLLRELVLLEAARRAERIGPRSYQQSRDRLIDAVARLGVVAERPRGAKKTTEVSPRKRPKSATERG
jgi:hypothetical protein